MVKSTNRNHTGAVPGKMGQVIPTDTESCPYLTNPYITFSTLLEDRLHEEDFFFPSTYYIVHHCLSEFKQCMEQKF